MDAMLRYNDNLGDVIGNGLNIIVFWDKSVRQLHDNQQPNHQINLNLTISLPLMGHNLSLSNLPSYQAMCWGRCQQHCKLHTR